jgi:hypothetical protein
MEEVMVLEPKGPHLDGSVPFDLSEQPNGRGMERGKVSPGCRDEGRGWCAHWMYSALTAMSTTGMSSWG